MSNIKVRVHDDTDRTSNQWARKLQTLLGNNFDVEPITSSEFEESLKVLERRRKLARSKSNLAVEPCPIIDDSDVLVIDYDLLETNRSLFLTGEEFAYLSRCYSRCGAIVVVNQYGKDTFDLTLKGHPESFADLNVGQYQLFCDGLWKENWKKSEFRSWHWPAIPQLASNLRRRKNELRDHLNEPIINYFGMGRLSLPSAAVEFLQGSLKKKPEHITFRDFVTNNSVHGLHRKDKPFEEGAITRIAASRIGKWLERLILPGQNILVDAPHLVSRFPSLLRGSGNNLANWNKVAELGRRGPLGIKLKDISDFRFSALHWLSRPAWLWADVSACKKIKEVRDPFAKGGSDQRFVFCEDTSRFVKRTEAQEFIADIPSPFVRRYVLKKRTAWSAVQYTPIVRFGM